MLRIISLLVLMVAVMAPVQAQAFCGFFVSKAGADLFNKASKVVLARSGERTVITMASDFRGDMKEFAMVIPVPDVITEKQVNVTENSIVEHLDAYTAPRLVEYFDGDPCQQIMMERMMMKTGAPMMAMADMEGGANFAKSLGVTIEAEYSVGEYDIVILSAKQSDGLTKYLNHEGYKMPKGAKKILGSYIKQDMKFFLAKVNLEEQAKSGYTYLRPLQVAYEHKKFMLPIRLGTLNADGDQELILYTLTQKGRVETANYRTVKIPTDVNIPIYTKEKFGEFYKAMFSKAVEKEGKRVVFLEYAWDMGWCDPCAADPLPNKDLRTLGVWWVDAPNDGIPQRGRGGRFMPPQPRAANVFVTRLHARYNAKMFPEDLVLQETEDRKNFQGRYILNHPWTKSVSCPAGKDYFAGLPKRFEKEAQNLANITGWDIAGIRKDMEVGGQSFKPDVPQSVPWWENIWE